MTIVTVALCATGAAAQAQGVRGPKPSPPDVKSLEETLSAVRLLGSVQEDIARIYQQRLDNARAILEGSNALAQSARTTAILIDAAQLQPTRYDAFVLMARNESIAGPMFSPTARASLTTAVKLGAPTSEIVGQQEFLRWLADPTFAEFVREALGSTGVTALQTRKAVWASVRQADTGAWADRERALEALERQHPGSPDVRVALWRAREGARRQAEAEEQLRRDREAAYRRAFAEYAEAQTRWLAVQLDLVRAIQDVAYWEDEAATDRRLAASADYSSDRNRYLDAAERAERMADEFRPERSRQQSRFDAVDREYQQKKRDYERMRP
jgi:hypothetical protein